MGHQWREIAVFRSKLLTPRFSFFSGTFFFVYRILKNYILLNEFLTVYSRNFKLIAKFKDMYNEKHDMSNLTSTSNMLLCSLGGGTF